MFSEIPQDPIMLLSFINTKLRDQYGSLETLCDDLQIDADELCDKLAAVGFTYNPDTNRFC